jgi:hypothetical protein
MPEAVAAWFVCGKRRQDIGRPIYMVSTKVHVVAKVAVALGG